MEKRIQLAGLTKLAKDRDEIKSAKLTRELLQN